MISNWDKCFDFVLQSEGKFVNDPRDPGGMTNLGVTKLVWERWVGHPVGEDEMRALTPDVVKPLYKKEYWDAVQADVLSLGIDYLLFDFAVNDGVHRAILLLQAALGVAVDGQLGQQTLAAVNAAYEKDRVALIEAYSDAKEKFYKSRSTFAIYGKGWLMRVDMVEHRAKVMANA